jgi:putative DNA primase/helicase
MSELPGILLWSLEGWRRLRKRGHFVQPDSGKPLAKQLSDLASPIKAWLEARCDVGTASYRGTPEELYRSWSMWCGGSGNHAGNKQVFARDLHAALPELEIRQARVEGKIKRFYYGVRLKPKA